MHVGGHLNAFHGAFEIKRLLERQRFRTFLVVGYVRIGLANFWHSLCIKRFPVFAERGRNGFQHRFPQLSAGLLFRDWDYEIARLKGSETWLFAGIASNENDVVKRCKGWCKISSCTKIIKKQGVPAILLHGGMKRAGLGFFRTLHIEISDTQWPGDGLRRRRSVSEDERGEAD